MSDPKPPRSLPKPEEQRRLAEEENAFWEQASEDERRQFKYNIERFWRYLDATRSSYQIRHRRTVLQANSEKLWLEVQEGLPIKTAALIVLMANREKRSIEEVLAEYKDQPVSSKKMRSKYQSRMDDWEALKQAGERRAEKAVRSVLMGEDPATLERADHILGKFKSEFKLLISDLRVAVRVDGHRSISRSKLVSACRQVGMDPPRLGLPVSPEERRKVRKVLGALHPDSTGGDKDKEEAFMAMAEALRVIDDYNEQCKRNGPSSERLPRAGEKSKKNGSSE